MSKPIVYISSTFFDLQDHRKYLINTLAKTERFDIVSMENYGTRSTPPTVKCLKDVESAEFYILLVGKRYGYIPQNSDVSITNLEYKTAIGDTTPGVGGVPATEKCVLPFLINDNWTYPEEVIKRIESETNSDGPELTKHKSDQLASWKRTIFNHFIIEPDGFTTPSDLASRVLAALIPELIDRNYGDVVRNLKLQPELSYRCDRIAIKNDFLFHNYNVKHFFKVFIVHGEKQEWPIFFSNNMAEYELNASTSSKTLNMDNYYSNFPNKFVDNFIRDAYQSVLRITPDITECTLEALALRATADERFNNIVLIYDMQYASWKEKYKKNLFYFFEKLAEANQKVKSSKAFYLLINIRYEKSKEVVKGIPPGSIVLEKLSPIRRSHIEEWVRSYFFFSAQKSDRIRNYTHELARSISEYYFEDYSENSPFPMQTAKERLAKIIADFNNNEHFFSNYTKPSKK